MDAVIMAGGEGTRLRPLTCDCPKPMARLCGRPALDYIFELLEQNGVRRAAVTLRYLPEAVRAAYPDGHFGAMALDFLEEDTPLGTAGSVKNALCEPTDELLVISGDALCDFDLAAAARFHREKHAAATLLTARVGDPREYGLVVADAGGAVQGFVEKPGWAQSVTDAVNTGVYLLSPEALALIPDGRTYDFGKELFPLMQQKNMALFAFDAAGYWCDIGDIGSYLQSQFDLLDGRVRAALPGTAQAGVRCKAARPAGRYTLVPPVYLGENVTIGDGAQIGPYAVLDDGCTVGARASVRRSVLLPGAYAGARAQLRGALLCPGASAAAGAQLFEGSVAGAGSVIGGGAVLAAGVRVWPGKRVEENAHVARNIKAGQARRGVFDDEGVAGETGVDLTPEHCARLGAAAGEAAGGGPLAVGNDGSPVGRAMAQAFVSGALSAGAQVLTVENAFEAQFLSCMRICGAGLGVFSCSAGARAMLRFCETGGLPLRRRLERQMEARIATGETPRCLPAQYQLPGDVGGLRLLYPRALAAEAPQGLHGLRAQVRAAARPVRTCMQRTLATLGCMSGGVRLHLTPAGTSASFFDEQGVYLSPAHTLALGCLAAFLHKKDAAVPYDTPRALDELAKQHGQRVLRYLSCPADNGDRDARALARRQPWVRDGLLLGVRVLALMRETGQTLHELAGRLPAFAISSRSLPLAGNPGQVLRAFSSAAPKGPSEGVLVRVRGGQVLLHPLKRGHGLRILAEAADMETADELCFDIQKQLNAAPENTAPALPEKSST